MACIQDQEAGDFGQYVMGRTGGCDSFHVCFYQNCVTRTVGEYHGATL